MSDQGEEVLLTGLPSFAARKTCEALLAGSPSRRVHAIVRDRDRDAFGAFLDELPLGARARVVAMAGDAAAIDLGLSGAEWRRLVGTVDRIHHVAGGSRLGLSREEAMSEHVASAKEVLELARHTKGLKRLVHHSSACVAGARTGIVREDELAHGQSFRTVVEEAQAHAESLVRREQRVPWSIVRPTLVVGDSETGEVDRHEGPYFLMLLIVTSPPDVAIPLVGKGSFPLHVVPADYVAKFAVRVGGDARAVHRTFHVKDPSPPTARRVFELVAEASGKRGPRGHIPANLTKALLRAPGLDRVAQSPRAFLDALLTPVEYDTSATDELLASSPLECPPFHTYVDKLVDFVAQRQRERRERRAEGSEPP